MCGEKEMFVYLFGHVLNSIAVSKWNYFPSGLSQYLQTYFRGFFAQGWTNKKEHFDLRYLCAVYQMLALNNMSFFFFFLSLSPHPTAFTPIWRKSCAKSASWRSCRNPWDTREQLWKKTTEALNPPSCTGSLDTVKLVCFFLYSPSEGGSIYCKLLFSELLVVFRVYKIKSGLFFLISLCFWWVFFFKQILYIWSDLANIPHAFVCCLCDMYGPTTFCIFHHAINWWI